jgi:hypothetical protein
MRNAECGIKILSLGLLLAMLAGGCATQKFRGSRPFDFQRDTFAFPNELIWVYHYDENGKWVHETRHPRPDYANHCFVVARSTRQFFQFARFDTNLPVADDATYRKLIYRVISIDPMCVLPESKKIVIPGYADLREFSAAHEKLLKSECGGAWESYFQRGHWRIVFPFSRAHQERTARDLLADLKQNRPPIVHLVRFPQLTINHAVLVFDARETDKNILFSIYDPNQPEVPRTLTYDRASRTFTFASNNYWPGGRLDVYEIFRRWDY